MKILLIEDERLIAKPLEAVLKKNKYNVDWADNGEDGAELGLSGLYDVIILDIMLPRMDGFQVLNRLRSSKIKTPVLMLTARSRVEDRIRGLDLGADDYLPKPFDNQELLARLRALSRRTKEIHHENILQIGDIHLNPQKLEVNGEKLTLKEAQILELLIQQNNRVTSKDFIIEKIWNFDSDADHSHVEYHISLLRKKLKRSSQLVGIQTLRGVGYTLKVVENG